MLRRRVVFSSSSVAIREAVGPGNLTFSVMWRLVRQRYWLETLDAHECVAEIARGEVHASVKVTLLPIEKPLLNEGRARAKRLGSCPSCGFDVGTAATTQSGNQNLT